MRFFGQPSIPTDKLKPTDRGLSVTVSGEPKAWSSNWVISQKLSWTTHLFDIRTNTTDMENIAGYFVYTAYADEPPQQIPKLITTKQFLLPIGPKQTTVWAALVGQGKYEPLQISHTAPRADGTWHSENRGPISPLRASWLPQVTAIV